MAINPLDSLREHLTAAAGSKTSGVNRSFEQLLDQTISAQQPLGADQARSWAALMKLEMMAGLLSWDQDAKSSAFSLPPLPRAAALQPSAPQRTFTLMSEYRPAPTSQATLEYGPKPATSSIDQLVDKAAQRYQVAPELIKAVIKAESSFNPKAVSPAGAQGLMQLMPATARELGVEDSFDPEQNIMGGTRYLRDLLKRYDGDLDSALAAYNWGMGNLARSDGRLPEETRTYQKRVKQFLAQYQQNSAG